MAEHQFDVTVIGAGPGGYVAAIRAAQNGLKVGLIERDKLGGICLNWGCVPSKALLKSAQMLNEMKKASEYGITVKDVSFDFGKIISRSRGVADRISKGVEYLMKKNKIQVIAGSAKITGKGAITVSKDGKTTDTVKTKNIIISTGARPRSIPGVEIDRKVVITSTEAMSLEKQPASMVVIGGGAIGVEFAYFYNALGTKVTIVEMLPSILPIEDKELTKTLESSLKKQGITILTQAKVEGIKTGKGVKVTVSTKDGKQDIEGDVALMAIGVQGNSENLGLDAVGVKVEKGFITVNELMKTNVDGIYAVGDISGPPLLAHVASHEGIVAADHIAGKKTHGIDRSNIPSCTYCQPQVASVGLTEEAALAKGHKLKIGRFPFRPLGKAMATGETEGSVKLIFDEKYGELLGAHIIGSEATELIGELGMAKALETTWEELHQTIHAHPTLSEGIMEAAGESHGASVHI